MGSPSLVIRMVRNSAFVFIKPHAVTDKVKELVKETFQKKEIAIKAEGAIVAEDIDKKMLVDKHYYAIASKATLLTPDKLPVPADKFKDKFGLDWNETLKSGNVLNAKDACEKMSIDSDELDKMWAGAKKAGDLVKFGGGFYCAKLTKGDNTYYVFNGFFMSMRSKFVEKDASIYYYVVEWDAGKLKWEDFRGKVLGPTDPAEAPADSLRGSILAKWKELDLKESPNTGDNGVHASASPFEALAERINWLGYRVERDPFGKLLLKAGASRKQIKDWSLDPQVTFGPIPITKSLFDTLEDTDSDWCLAYCQMIANSAQPAPKAGEGEITKLKAQLEAFKPLEKAVLAIQAYVAPPEPKTRYNASPEPKGKKGQAKAAASPSKGQGKGKGDSKPKKGGAKSAASPGKGQGKGKGRGKVQ